jgi:hypothetical protein
MIRLLLLGLVVVSNLAAAQTPVRTKVFPGAQALPLIAGVQQGALKPGGVLVLRGCGPKGGPAMAGSASRVVFAIYAAGLENDVAFVSDGQLSGLCNKGVTVAEVSPESATGGPLGHANHQLFPSAPLRREPRITGSREYGMCLSPRVGLWSHSRGRLGTRADASGQLHALASDAHAIHRMAHGIGEGRKILSGVPARERLTSTG